MKTKSKIGSDIFTIPLTDRGYLLFNAEKYVYSTSFSSIIPYTFGKDFSQKYLINDFVQDFLHVMSVLYLYGAEFKNIHLPYDKKSKSNKINESIYSLEPSFCFTRINKPILNKNNEVKIIKENLKKLGYDTWYPHNWATEDGEKIRTIVSPILNRQKQTKEMKKWENDYNDLCSLVDVWYKDFLKKNKEKMDFSFKLYGHEGYAQLTVLDEKISSTKDLQKIKERQEEHMRVFRLFSMYLYKGFLEEGKFFPKCLYE
jgi:hypothetical protein